MVWSRDLYFITWLVEFAALVVTKNNQIALFSYLLSCGHVTCIPHSDWLNSLLFMQVITLLSRIVLIVTVTWRNFWNLIGWICFPPCQQEIVYYLAESRITWCWTKAWYSFFIQMCCPALLSPLPDAASGHLSFWNKIVEFKTFA